MKEAIEILAPTKKNPDKYRAGMLLKESRGEVLENLLFAEVQSFLASGGEHTPSKSLPAHQLHELRALVARDGIDNVLGFFEEAPTNVIKLPCGLAVSREGAIKELVLMQSIVN